MTSRFASSQYWFLLLAGVLLLPACTSDGQLSLLGYTSRPVHDSSIRTVRVPIFKNKTYRQGLEYELTEAVIHEIEARTPWKVVPEGCPADTELVGKIVSRNKNLYLFNQLGETLGAEATMSVEVVWKDLRFGQYGAMPSVASNQPLPPVAVPPPQPAKVLVQSKAAFRPELGQSLTSAENTMTKRMARQIVNMMERPW